MGHSRTFRCALRRIGRLGDGYLAYVVTPEMYRAALDTIGAAAEQASRDPRPFGTGHLLFTRIDDSYDKALDAIRGERPEASDDATEIFKEMKKRTF